jgi:hypothetical protein
MADSAAAARGRMRSDALYALAPEARGALGAYFSLTAVP